MKTERRAIYVREGRVYWADNSFGAERHNSQVADWPTFDQLVRDGLEIEAAYPTAHEILMVIRQPVLAPRKKSAAKAARACRAARRK